MRWTATSSLCIAATLACAGAPSPRDAPQRSSSRVLAGAELEHPHAANALDLIRVRRPAFLRLNGPAGKDEPVFYIDDSRAMSIEELRLLPTDMLVEIRYLTAAEATFRYGRGHSGGAVVVRTRHKRDASNPYESDGRT